MIAWPGNRTALKSEVRVPAAAGEAEVRGWGAGVRVALALLLQRLHPAVEHPCRSAARDATAPGGPAAGGASWLARALRFGQPMGEAGEPVLGGGYERRRPETTVLHQAVREGWPSVKGLVPKRLEEEVRRYLECGRLCYGFVHLELL